MRLIRTTGLTLHDFVGGTAPKYAILSHRWEEDEICLQELEERKNTQKPGWKKVESFCRFALEKGFDYVWIDACCIDRTSSAELSEAINSMHVRFTPCGNGYLRIHAGTNGMQMLASVSPTSEMSISQIRRD